MKDRKAFLFSFLWIIGAISIFLNSAFAQELFAPKEVHYDELEEGEVIPFDSSLGIDAFFPSKNYLEGTLMDTVDGPMGNLVVSGSINLYWCKDETCLENEIYDVQKKVLEIGVIHSERVYDDNLYFDGSATVNVSNYKDVFQEQGSEYVGWEVHFVDSGVLQVHYTFGTGFWGDVKQVGNYQNIVLTPVTREYVDCVNRDDVDIEYYVEKKVDITDSPWYKDNVINDYEALSDPVNLTSWEKPANFSFEADKGDKLVLRLKTDTPNLKITLDGVEQPLPEIFYQDEELSCENINPNRYYDYEVAILSTGKHTFEITYLGKDTFSFPYIYLEDLKILKPIQVEEVTEDEYTLEVKTCPNGYQVKDYHGERNDETAGGVVDGNAADKVDTPNTMDNVLIFVLTMGIGICLTGWSLILRRKIVSSNK